MLVIEIERRKKERKKDCSTLARNALAEEDGQGEG